MCTRSAIHDARWRKVQHWRHCPGRRIDSEMEARYVGHVEDGDTRCTPRFGMMQSHTPSRREQLVTSESNCSCV